MKKQQTITTRGRLTVLSIAPLLALMCCDTYAVINYVEPPDLTPNLANPDPLGSVSLGANSVSGTIDLQCDSGFCFGPDDADAFEFIVPAGLTVTTIELDISNYTTADGAFARVRNFSGGTSTNFITGDTTFPNLVTTPGGLTAGTYDLQVHSISGGGFPDDEIGTLSLSYIFEITSVPEPSTALLLVGGILGLAGYRRR